jgi:hypothetical protein
MEVHHAVPEEVERMIGKKQWAQQLLKHQAPNLQMRAWQWVVPRGGSPLFTPNHPKARLLAAAGIGFPSPRLAL